MLVGGALMLTMPAPAESAATGFSVADGKRAHVSIPGVRTLPVAVERPAHETFYRGARESDEDAIEAAFAMSEWIEVADGQAVRILAVDGEASQIELLEGPYAGRRAWLKTRRLGP